MLSAVRGSRAAPSPSIATLTPSASDRTTSLWSAHARPSASNPGPRLADVAGTLTWTRTRLEPLEEPVGGERDGPGVEDDVVVGEDEHAHHDQDQACRALHDRDEWTVAAEELQERAERPGRQEERNAERHEDDREPHDEGQRVTQDPPAHRPREVRGEVGDGHARDERQVRRKERQHARRQEREESRAERDGDPEGFAHRDRSSPSISEWDASLSHSRGPSAIAVRWP